MNFTKLRQYLQRFDWFDIVILVASILGISIFDIIQLFVTDFAVPSLQVKVAVYFIVLGITILFVGRKREFKALHSFEENSLEEAQFLKNGMKDLGNSKFSVMI